MMKFDSYKPLTCWDYAIQDSFREHALFLQQDLHHNYLQVVLVIAPEPLHATHKIRAVENENPPWYRKIYNTHQHWRRDRTEQALERIIANKDKLSIPYSRQNQLVTYACYDSILRSLIFNHLTQGFEYQGVFQCSPSAIHSYFELEAPENHQHFA